MAELKMKENIYNPLPNEEENTKIGRIDVNFKPGKWIKHKNDEENNLQQN